MSEKSSIKDNSTYNMFQFQGRSRTWISIEWGDTYLDLGGGILEGGHRPGRWNLKGGDTDLGGGIVRGISREEGFLA